MQIPQIGIRLYLVHVIRFQSVSGVFLCSLRDEEVRLVFQCTTRCDIMGVVMVDVVAENGNGRRKKGFGSSVAPLRGRSRGYLTPGTFKARNGRDAVIKCRQA